MSVRRTKAGSADASRNVGYAAGQIENIYFNGFKNRRGPFRIKRRTIREFLLTERLTAAATDSLVRSLRLNGFLMFPIGEVDPVSAKEWVVERIDLKEIPVVTGSVIQRAAGRAESYKIPRARRSNR